MTLHRDRAALHAAVVQSLGLDPRSVHRGRGRAGPDMEWEFEFDGRRLLVRFLEGADGVRAEVLSAEPLADDSWLRRRLRIEWAREGRDLP